MRRLDVIFARYSSAISTRNRYYGISAARSACNSMSFHDNPRIKETEILWRFCFARVAIRITNQVLSILDEAIDASTQPTLPSFSFIPDSNTHWILNASWFTLERSSSKSICSGASAPLMILNIAPAPVYGRLHGSVASLYLRNIGLLV